MPQHFETLIYCVKDAVATISLNRPDRLNAINNQMITELITAFDLTDADDDVRVVIVTGAGRAFSAGADLSGGSEALDFEINDDPHSVVERGLVRDGGGRVALRIFSSLKPVIGAINGAAVGAGATIPLAMDIRLASNTAKFGFPFARRGIVPESASSWFLPRIVGISTALEWCFSGRLLSAEEAKERNLVQSIHAPDELLNKANSIARDIADNTAPVSVALTRQMLWRMLGADHPMQAHKVDSLAVKMRGSTADAQEGINAFLEKRAAVYPETVSDALPDIWSDWQEPRF